MKSGTYKWDGERWVMVTDRASGPPDIYFKEPYHDEHLASEEYPGTKFISSRAEKKMWLERCHLRESGDRVHGASTFDPISHRHAEESLRRKGYVGQKR